MQKHILANIVGEDKILSHPPFGIVVFGKESSNLPGDDLPDSTIALIANGHEVVDQLGEDLSAELWLYSTKLDQVAAEDGNFVVLTEPGNDCSYFHWYI